MDIAESIGFVQFWGFTPSANLLENGSSSEKKIFLSGLSDIRHILRTLSENSLSSGFPLTFYLHENNKEVLARHMFFIYLINDMALPIRERVEIFLEVYGNCLIRERAAEYVSQASQNLIKIVTQHKNAPSVKSVFDLSALKFKERDDLEEIFRSWALGVDFDMVGLRDQRLRYHYKERYDHRENLVDWDYHWGYKEIAPQVNYRHYREWRRSGIAYEYRFATYTAPNRTLSSYIPGKKKLTKDSVLVRGFWADIVNSPYWAFGLDVNCCETCAEILNKVANIERVHHEGDISDFNLTKMLHQMETYEVFHFPPEKDRMRAYNKMWSNEEQKCEEIKEVEETKEEDQIESGNGEVKNMLGAFERFSVKIVPILEPISSLGSKRKYQGFFDRVVIGGASSIENIQAIGALGCEDCLFSIEGVNFVSILKKEQKEEAMMGIKGVAEGAGWVEVARNQTWTCYRKQGCSG